MRALHLNITRQLSDFTLQLSQVLPLDGVTGVFGPSGSGKTTLLRILAGLDTHARGSIEFDGDQWLNQRSQVPAHRRGVGLVFQDTRLFSHLDVAGNLRFAEQRAQQARTGPSWDTVIDALDLTGLLERPVGSLSGGEAQRVAIGRSLLARPRLLLLDEPLAALDRRRRSELLPYLESLPSQFDVPILHVTHAIDEVARLAANVLVMHQGQAAGYGPTADILERIDAGNLADAEESGVLLNAAVASHLPENGLTRLALGDQPLIVPRVAAGIGTPVRLRIRARDVAVATTAPKGISIRNVLRTRIEKISDESDPAYSLVVLALGDMRLRARLTRAATRDLGLSVGQTVFALVKSVALDGDVFTREV